MSRNQILIKLACLLVLLFALGLPILSYWETWLLAFCVLGLIFGVPRFTARGVTVVSAMAMLLVLVRLSMPTLEIEEGHNVFLYKKSGGVLEAELPKAVFDDWREAFSTLYSARDDKEISWYNAGVPDSLYGSSSDALWSGAKYSRRVNDIDFDSLATFRGTFVNDLKYNYFAGDLHRRLMPFWVMYEFPAMRDFGTLYWKGSAWVSGENGNIQRVYHAEREGMALGRADYPRRVYLFFMPGVWPESVEKVPYLNLPPGKSWENLRERTTHPEVRLERPWQVVGGEQVVNLLGAALALSLVFGCFSIRSSAYFKGASLLVLAIGVMHVLLYFDWGHTLGTDYAPHGGGDDGMFHDYWGVMMAESLMKGDVVDALRGVEDVYYFTPGLRYFRMLEKIVFGSTHLGYYLVLALCPLVIYGLARCFVGTPWAMLMALVFLLIPASWNFSFSQYVLLGRLGYPASMGNILFFLGAALWLRNAFGVLCCGRSSLLFLGGVCLFLAVFMRPNNAIPVAVLGGLFVLWMLSNRRWLVALLVIAGMGTGLWMPLHNLVYGQAFYLITNSTGVALTVSTGDYIQAASDFLSGREGSESVAFVSERLRQIFLSPPQIYPSWMDVFAPAGVALRLLALLLVLGGLVRVRWKDIPFSLMAVAMLASFPFLLFIFFPQPRYAMLGWDLAIMLGFVIVVRYVLGPWQVRRAS